MSYRQRSWLVAIWHRACLGFPEQDFSNYCRIHQKTCICCAGNLLAVFRRTLTGLEPVAQIEVFEVHLGRNQNGCKYIIFLNETFFNFYLKWWWKLRTYDMVRMKKNMKGRLTNYTYCRRDSTLMICQNFGYFAGRNLRNAIGVSPRPNKGTPVRLLSKRTSQ